MALSVRSRIRSPRVVERAVPPLPGVRPVVAPMSRVALLVRAACDYEDREAARRGAVALRDLGVGIG